MQRDDQHREFYFVSNIELNLSIKSTCGVVPCQESSPFSSSDPWLSSLKDSSMLSAR